MGYLFSLNMPLEAKINGIPIEYIPSPLQTLFERLSYINERNFYTRRIGKVIQVKISPAYFDRDTFKYKAAITDDGKEISTRLSEPLREYLTISTQNEKEISIERDVRKRSVLVKQNCPKDKFTSRRIFTIDNDEELEKYVRGLL